MSHRSSGSEKHRTKQRSDVWTPEGQLKPRGGKVETLPPITDNFSRYSTNMYMTGKLGLLSSPQKPRPPKVAVSPPNYCNSECDMSKARQKTTSKHVSPEEFHTTSHSQHQGGTSHRSVNRSGSHDPKPTRPPHKRSSSISETPCFVQGPSKPPPGSEMRPVKAKPAESRQTWSQDMWTGTGFDLIGHRQPFNPSVSRKKESNYSVRAPDGHCALAQSALNDSTAHQLQLAQQETLSSSNIRDKTTQRFDGSPARSRRHDTERRTSHLYNVNNNSNAGGSPPRVPCSSSNEENPQSYQLSTTMYQGLSGGGGRHSKHKQYAANGSVGNNIQLDSLYSPRGSRGSSRTSTPHKSPSPPLQSPSPLVVRVTSGRGGLRGLRNLGNTCFMNSILQCLSHTPGMAYLFLNQQRLKYCSKSMLKGELAKAYASLVSEMWSGEEGGAVSPHAFKSQIQKYARRFMGYEQQDCQEFLRFMLAGLHDDLNQPKQRPKSAKSFPSTQAEANYRWEKYLSHECSKISDLFMGQLQSTLVCLKCKSNSLTFDPFWDLSLPMPRAKGYTSGAIPLESCLDGFTDKEKLTGSEQAYCDKCDALCDSEKWFQLQRLPEILVLHLKRFSGLRFRSKLDTPVVVPLDLDLKRYCVNRSDESAKYCLYAMSNHSGTAYGGHYTALSRHVYSKKWYNFNDSHVTEACPPTPSNAYTTSQAYVLFYHKKA